MKNNKDNNTKGVKATIVSFFVLMFVGACVALYLPLRPTISESENRELTKFPEFSISALMDGSYFSGISTWYADTFPMREMFMNANAKIKSFYGIGDSISGFSDNYAEDIPEVGEDVEPATLPAQDPETTAENKTQSQTEKEDETEAKTEIKTEAESEEDAEDHIIQELGAVLIVDKSAYEYYNFVQSTADKYASAINTTGAKLKGKARVFDIVVPTSIDINLSPSVRQGINTSDQKKATNYIYSRISSDVTKVNAFDALYEKRNEYLYFRTDHHWTARGAYYTYYEYAKSAGITAHPLSYFEEQDHGEFLGTFYNDSGKNTTLEKNPDKFYVYMPKGDIKMTVTDKNGNRTNPPLIADASQYSRGLKYLAFIAGDNPYTHIVNSSITDGSSCLVIKESFGNAFVPFLTANYGEIHVIDYRYWSGNIASFVETNGIDDVIFINNMSATRNKSIINKLAGIS
ncbi:MAG: hypothetical protein IIW48_03415 [Clostridia bacterium]|nr:hypothetical protein [Clostridia bacterium]